MAHISKLPVFVSPWNPEEDGDADLSGEESLKKDSFEHLVFLTCHRFQV